MCQCTTHLSYALRRDTIALMHKSIDKVLADLMADKGVSQADLARKTGVNQPTISRILKPSGPKGIKEPTDKQVRPLADFFGVTTDQLRGYSALAGAATVEAQPKTSSAELVAQMLAKHGRSLTDEARQQIISAASDPAPGTDYIPARPNSDGLVGDEVWIAHYDVRAAMGGGQIPHDYPEMFQDVRVSPKHLREMGVEFAEHFHLKMVTGWGQSMAPTIKHRDPVLVDVTIREFVGDGVYLFSYGDLLYIKRLQMKGLEHFRMLSDNERHKPEEIRVDDTHIQAKVLYVWNGHLL